MAKDEEMQEQNGCEISSQNDDGGRMTYILIFDGSLACGHSASDCAVKECAIWC